MESLEGFVSNSHKIDDYTPLYKFAQLRSLSLGRGIDRRSAVFDVLNFERLERLYLGEKIPRQDQIYFCRHLTHLGLAGFPVKGGGEFLKNFPHLRVLKMAASGITDVDGLAQTKSLEEIDFAFMKNLNSLDGLKGSLPALRKVSLEGCSGMGSIDALLGADDVEFLWLYDCGKIDSLRPVAHMRSLSSLNIGGSTDIVDGQVAFLRSLPRLVDVRGVCRSHYDLSKKDFLALSGK